MNKYLVHILLILPLGAFGQKELEIGLFGGFANYQGDLVAPHIEFSETKFSYGVFARYHLSEKVKFKLNGYFGFISGSDENNTGTALRNRGWSFESTLQEVAVTAEYHPIGRSRLGETGIFRKQISPYAFAGAGMVIMTPTVAVEKPEDEALFPETDFNSTSLTVPFGAGVRADLFEFLSLGFEVGWRVTLSDYLDGVSQNGNPDKNDTYIFLGATLSYFFPTPESGLNF
jgi:hypothetical protein